VGWREATAGSGLAAVLYDATRDTAAADLRQVVAFLRLNAKRYGLDMNRVVIWCSSANVTIGLPYAMDPAHGHVRAAVVYYGDAEIADIRLDLPLFYARAGRDVPELNARIDALVARALRANAPWTVVNVPAGVHGFDAFDSDDVAREVVARTLTFMREVTAPATSLAYGAAAEEAANAAAFARGDWDAAVAGYRRRLNAQPADAEGHRRLGLALSQRREFAEALVSLEKAWELGRRGPRDTALPAAVAAAGARDVERAVHWLGVLLATPFGGDPASYLTDPRFEPIRDDPAFTALIAKHARR
jgi:tetratricopeptide (TPR) repeat protein